MTFTGSWFHRQWPTLVILTIAGLAASIYGVFAPVHPARRHTAIDLIVRPERITNGWLVYRTPDRADTGTTQHKRVIDWATVISADATIVCTPDCEHLTGSPYRGPCTLEHLRDDLAHRNSMPDMAIHVQDGAVTRIVELPHRCA
ncbi:hypothetical protein ACFVUS_02635 [Nocardia sp. NPDC058058]|uniref:hypothetical protein n=1 Tax=Nocardia sp. NPDC058058 TaxID=3346317 RepID=UPI0036DC7B15